MPPENAVLTARERARRELTAEILAAGRRQVAASGAAALSLRAVARELGMASSAVYRYFATRDDLLTALIVEAYDGLGDAVEVAAAPGPGRSARARWTAACRAVRDWATAHPHQYALIHGSPVPGYTAPEGTVAPGTRVPRALLGVVAGRPAPAGPPLDPVLAGQAQAVAGALAPDVAADLAPELVVQGAAAWASLFGLVSFEVFGQLRGGFDDAGPLFERAVADLADGLGL